MTEKNESPDQARAEADELPQSPIRRFLIFIPLIAFLGLAFVFWSRLGYDSSVIPSVLINQEVPPFSLEPLLGRDDKGFSSEDLKGDVSLVNIFGSWCVACRVEHPFLVRLKQRGEIPIHGIDWKEKDPTAGPTWLRQLGDPYTLAGDDPKSKAAIAFGVTGAPETFVVDKKGVIRYKHVGPLTPEIWVDTLKPIVEKLRAEGASPN